MGLHFYVVKQLKAIAGHIAVTNWPFYIYCPSYMYRRFTQTPGQTVQYNAIQFASFYFHVLFAQTIM